MNYFLAILSAASASILWCVALPIIWILLTIIYAATYMLPTNLKVYAKDLRNITRIEYGDALVTALSPLMSAVGLCFTKKTDRNMPKFFWKWDNDEYGLDGDPPWRGPEHANGNQSNWIWRFKWLTRNPANNWSYHHLGYQAIEGTTFKVVGDIETRNRDPGKSGSFSCTATTPDGKKWPCFMVVKQWGKSGRCLRMYLGWKNQSLSTDGTMTQYVFAINPLMGFK